MPRHWLVPGVTLVGKVNLVTRDQRGFIEHIEFKTGRALPDVFQQVICRIGACSEHNSAGLPVLSTTVQLSSGAEYELDNDRSVLRLTLTEIEQTVLQIWESTT